MARGDLPFYPVLFLLAIPLLGLPPLALALALALAGLVAASVHVSNILAKLGVRSRGEAAALAHRSGLA